MLNRDAGQANLLRFYFRARLGRRRSISRKWLEFDSHEADESTFIGFLLNHLPEKNVSQPISAIAKAVAA